MSAAAPVVAAFRGGAQTLAAEVALIMECSRRDCEGRLRFARGKVADRLVAEGAEVIRALFT